MLYVKPRFKKDSLLIPYPTPSRFGIIENPGGRKVKFLHFQKTKHSNTGQKLNITRVSYGNN